MDNRMSLLTSPFVPEGMVDLMKKLSKGVIKERPSNIYEYAAAFFEKMLIERDGSLDKGYGKFRSYTEYCKFMDKMDQRRLNQTTKIDDDITDTKDTTDNQQEDIVQHTNIEVQGVAIQGVERKSRDSVKNVSINPKYKSQSEQTAKPVVSNVKNVKTKPRKLSSKKPSENLIVIKEETSADVDDNGNGEFKLNQAATAIQKAFRMYMSKKSGQGEHIPETSQNVSQLSEDAAAVIIQKAFKSLIQKLKPDAQNCEKVADESNNNIVIIGAGQENTINVDRMINNTDENSEQILVYDDRTDIKNDLEQEKTFEDTTTNLEIEITNLDAVTALDATGTQPLEEVRIESKESVRDENTNQAVTTTDIIYESSNNHENNQPNEASIHSAGSPLDVKTETNVNEEVTVLSGTSSDDLQLKEEKVVEDPVDTIGIAVQSPENELGVDTSENVASNETQVQQNICDDPPELEAILHLTEAALEKKINFTDDKEAGEMNSEPKQQGNTTEPLNLAVTDSGVDNIITVTNTGTEIDKIDEIEKKEQESQMEQTEFDDEEQNTTLAELSENISHASVADEDLNNLNGDRTKSNPSLTDNNLTEEKVVESPVEDQLFVVEKGGIYVNMDVLQEKFGTTAIDDMTGSDSEKTFKLNILEREEILVNQENVQQIREEAPVMSEDVVDKSSDIVAGKNKLEGLEKEEAISASRSEAKDKEVSEESTSNCDTKDEEGGEEPTSNCDTKDEDGNEEYELAETVVLMDIPSKSHHESEPLLLVAVPENVTVDTMKLNKLDDEIEKADSSAIDERSLEKFGDSVKDRIMNSEFADAKADELLKQEAVVENIEIMGKLDKMENSQSTLNLQEISIKEHDAGADKTSPENIDQLSQNELTASESKEIVISEGVFSEGGTNNENVESQMSKSELTAPDYQEILKEEEVVEDNKIKNESVESQLNELTAPDSEEILKVEEVIEDNKINDESVESQPNELSANDSEKIVNVGKVEEEEFKDEKAGENDLASSDSEKIVKVESVFDNKEIENDSANIQNKTELTATDSVNVPRVEAVLEGEEIKHENTETQFINTELTATDNEKTVKVEGALEDEETKNETVEIQLKEGELEPALPKSENISIQGNEIDGVNTASVSGNLQVEIENSGENNEVIVKSENQLGGEDKECNVELESKTDEKDDEVIQGKTQKTEENVATSSTTEKIDLLKEEGKTVKRDTEAETADQLIENKENEELVKAATIIQKIFRGYIVRNSPTVNVQGNGGQLQLSAALTIQKYVRGYLVRKNKHKIDNLRIDQVTSTEMKNVENDTNGTEDNSNIEMVPQLPAYSNRFLIPKDSFLERESFADDEDYARTCKELAATSIQKTYRGYRVRRSLKTSSETDAASDDINREVENEIEPLGDIDQVQTAVTEAERVISDVLNVAADVLPLETYDLDSFEDEVTDDKNVELESAEISDKPSADHGSVLGQVVHDNIHVEGQMHQKYNRMKFRGSPINPIEETSDSSEQPETPREKLASTVKSKTLESDSLDSKDYDGSKSFSYEQLSSDLSDTEENKRESQKESEDVDETSRDERDDLSEVENFDLSSCGEDSLEAMYYSLRKNEIMVDKMQKQVADQRVPRNDDDDGCVASENAKVEFPERVTESLDVAMQQVFKSMESSSDYDGGKKDEDDNSSALDLALDDSSSVNDEKEIETSRQVKQFEELNSVDNEGSGSTIDIHAKDVDRSSESNTERDVETSNIEQSEQSDSSVNINGDVQTSNMEQSQQSDNSVNSSTRFIMKSQSVSEDMMNPIMFAMKRKQALLDQLHVRPYPLQENLSEDHDAFPEHLLTDIDIGNIQRKIFASSISETDSDYIEPTTTGRRLVRDDFNISTALDHLSTDSDSTIVSAATKIQAGARGFLTRRRLRRSSAGGTSISFEKRYSFGNAAIDKSLEDLIKMQEQINLDGAALKIQQQYRRYQARKNNLKKVSPIREQTTLELSGGSSIDGNEGTDDNIGIREITLAQKKVDDNQENAKEKVEDNPISLNIDTVDTVGPVKRTPVNQRRLTLQRGDAVQRNSRPDSQDSNIKDGDLASPNSQSTEQLKDSETGEYTGTTDSKPVKKEQKRDSESAPNSKRHSI